MKKLNKEWSNCHLFRSCKHVDPTTFQICWKIDPTHLKQILHIQVNNWLVNQSERSYYWHQTLTNGQLLQSTWDGKSSEKMARSALTKRWHDLKTVKLPWAQSSPQGEKQQSLDIWTRVTSLTKKKQRYWMARLFISVEVPYIRSSKYLYFMTKCTLEPTWPQPKGYSHWTKLKKRLVLCVPK